MKTQINSFAAVLALALSVGLMIGCSQQGVDGELARFGEGSTLRQVGARRNPCDTQKR